MRLYLYIYLVFAISLNAQISPGDLTEAHKHLEGMSNCTKCHELGEEVTNDKCLDCHSDIRQSLQNNKGFHSSSDVIDQKCYNCHSEHHGRNFDIIRFDHDEFDHTLTGFELTGKHNEIECEDCHNTEFIQTEKHREKEETFLGLSQSCSSCHTDYHQGTLGDACADCHDTNKFIPASKFNHDNAKFALRGAHTEVECRACHNLEIRNNKSFQVFKGLQFENCIDCHQDIHKGKFGTNCESCHSVQSFKRIKNIDRFDHSKTNFPLVGQHQFVKCESCHQNSLSSKPKHEKCIDCHDDYHQGDFNVAGQIKDCSECHSEKGFLPSTFTLELHQKSQFPLTGSHLALPCVYCHKTGEDYEFDFRTTNCIECHDNIHSDKISSQFLNEQRCEDCHTTNFWSEINFDHNRTNFKLEGRHAATPCSDCHFTVSENEVEQVFIGLSTGCESCHEDIHFNQFRIEGQTDCAGCHGFANWNPLKFDHSKTEFPLDGKHKNVACEKCHEQIETPVGKYVKYKFEDITCKNCHS